jgi:DNA-binding transcriptional MerR regulator
MEEISIGEFSRRSRLSMKALRLYDELGLLVPARVDAASGYRYYEIDQVEDARLVSMLRQLEYPLATIKELLLCDPADAAMRIAANWRDAEVAHVAQRHLAEYLVKKLNGKEHVMYEVNKREVPERTLLCLKRNVDEKGAWALGKEFIAIMRERPLPTYDGREGAMFMIFWGEVNADSDGPVEMCKPIPATEAGVAEQYPEFTLRVEPAHLEAFVSVTAGSEGAEPGSIQLASESLHLWTTYGDNFPEHLEIKPEVLGVRLTYFSTGPLEARVPDFDFAVTYK